jgi:hypothetical protein
MREEPNRPAGFVVLGAYRIAHHPNRPRSRPHEPRQNLEEGSLAGTIRPKHHQRLSPKDREVNPPKYPQGPEGPLETLPLQHGQVSLRHRCRCLARGTVSTSRSQGRWWQPGSVR